MEDCCRNGCILFYGKYAGNESCVKCSAARYIITGVRRKRRRAAAQAHYFSLQALIRLVLFDREVAANWTYHHTHFMECSAAAAAAAAAKRCRHEKSGGDGSVRVGRKNNRGGGEDDGGEEDDDDHYMMHDIHCSPMWKSVFRDAQEREDGRKFDPFNVGLMISVDGVSPFKFSQYTMWPVTVMLMNLPHHLRVKQENLLIPAIIPGPKQPWDLDSFMQPLVDELRFMEDEGFEIVDYYSQEQPFERNVKAFLLYTPLDIKASVKARGVVPTAVLPFHHTQP